MCSKMNRNNLEWRAECPVWCWTASAWGKKLLGLSVLVFMDVHEGGISDGILWWGVKTINIDYNIDNPTFLQEFFVICTTIVFDQI